jgi:glyoxylase I family protein
MTKSIKDFVVRQHHTAVSCHDWDKMKAFFVDMLGFTVVGEIENRNEPLMNIVTGMHGQTCRWAMLELGGYHIELFKWLSPEGRPSTLKQNDVGYTHIAFQIKDADEVRRRLMAAGYAPISEVQSLRDGRARPFYCKGPEGLYMEFVEYPFGA